MIDKNKKYKTIGEVAKILGLVNNKSGNYLLIQLDSGKNNLNK